MVVRIRKRPCSSGNSNTIKRRKTDTFSDESKIQLKCHHKNKYVSAGLVLTLGVGDTGQLGLGSDITELMKPAILSTSSSSIKGLDSKTSFSFVQVVAGGMHTVCLTADGRVYTFGCNDEGALGRPSIDTPCENKNVSSDSLVEESRPGVVIFPENNVHIQMISAGDSHSAALDDLGRVWLWGTFRGASGVIGLTKNGEVCRFPVRLSALAEVVVKIVSGQDHLVCLTEEGRLRTMGCGEQGQLGRIAERFSKDGGRNGFDLLLQPGECRIRGTKRFIDVWAGGFATIARCMNSGVVYACGLNNYGQLSLIGQIPDELKEKMDIDGNAPLTGEVAEQEQLSESTLIKRQGPLIQFMLTPANGFEPENDWTQFAIGMHHTLALASSGKVYAVGRSDYGRLGFPINGSNSDVSSVSYPHLVHGPLLGRSCCWIGSGEACSFAIDDAGHPFSWGMGSNQQLAHKGDEEDASEPGEMLGKNLINRRVIMIDAGGQHTVMLATDASSINPESSKVVEKTSRKAFLEKGKQITDNNHTGQSPMNTVSEANISTKQIDPVEKPVSDKLSTTNPLSEIVSAAGATLNSSSAHSYSFAASDQSSLSSAHSTDGGGSSRMGGSLFAQPLDAPLTLKVGNTLVVEANCGGSTTSTSEPGFPLTDAGSNTASPANTH